MGYSGARRKLVNEKNLKQTSHVRLPLNMNKMFIQKLCSYFLSGLLVSVLDH